VLSATEPRIKRKIAELSDHKGILTVRWKTAPTEKQKFYLLQLWAQVGGEDWANDYVQHE
jgi:hypothetical protein